MPLTRREYSQIYTALNVAGGINVNEEAYVPTNNVLLLLEKFIEEEAAVVESADTSDLESDAH